MVNACLTTIINTIGDAAARSQWFGKPRREVGCDDEGIEATEGELGVRAMADLKKALEANLVPMTVHGSIQTAIEHLEAMFSTQDAPECATGGGDQTPLEEPVVYLLNAKRALECIREKRELEYSVETGAEHTMTSMIDLIKRAEECIQGSPTNYFTEDYMDWDDAKQCKLSAAVAIHKASESLKSFGWLGQRRKRHITDPKGNEPPPREQSVET